MLPHTDRIAIYAASGGARRDRAVRRVMAGVGLLEALAERFSRRFGFEYGQARAWESFGNA